jgi:predicted ATPase/DNA-binding winged helix-turn-helix (wHTH) protein
MYEIGPFRLDPDAGVVTHGGQTVPLGPRAVAVLKTLVERPQQSIPKQRILEAAWPGVVVEESNLAVQVSAIRRAFAAVAGGERWIETVSRRGYRFVGPVRWVAPATRASAPTNIPKAPSTFVGRDLDIAVAGHLLENHRLLTIVGPGGIGKTRLAQRVGDLARGRYLDGVWFVDLSPIIGNERVAATVAEALAVPLAAGKPPVDALRNRLRDRAVLILLDNCEHVLEGSAALAASLLRETPHLSILATSREALRTTGEQVYPLGPLPPPDAVRLFVERAREQLPGLEISPERARTIESLCMHLDGIPLALELAAARARSLTVEQIHARLDDRFRLLTSGARAVIPRHQTLRAALEWSFDLLDETERAVLRRCAIFAGGFTLEAAAHVASCGAIDEYAVTDLLLQLVSRSLVVADTAESAARYRMLETTRAFAFEKLREAGELDDLHRRHARYFRKLFEHAPDDYIRQSDAHLRSVYLSELDNVRSALDWAMGPGNDRALAIGLAARTHWLWTVRVLLAEGIARLDAAAARVDASTPPEDEAELRFALGVLHVGKPNQQLAHWERAVELFRRVGDARALGLALSRHSRTFSHRGETEVATRMLEEARAYVQADGGTKLLAAYHSEVAFCRMMAGDLHEAREHYDLSYRLFVSMGATAMANQLRDTLADVRWALGDLEGAIAMAKEAVQVWRGGPWRTVIGYDLINLAGMHAERGDLDEALGFGRDPEGLALARDRGTLWMFIDHFALIAARRGKLDVAARLEGFAERGHLTTQALRQPNELRAHQRVMDLLRASLDAARLASLMEEGARLDPEAACRLALQD